MTTAQSVTNEELDQILQTIEMFEVILQSNAEDCQSMEILKEAYWKLNRQKDALKVTRKLADTYYALGQYSSALLEYEGILQKDPGNAEVVAMLARGRGQAPPGQRQGAGEAAARRLPDRHGFRRDHRRGPDAHHHQRHHQAGEQRRRTQAG